MRKYGDGGRTDDDDKPSIPVEDDGPGPAERLFTPPEVAPIDIPAPVVAGKGIRAYHGSPHDFDRFDMSKIGTGEGAQVYGHGLYFAGNEATAKYYRDALQRDAELFDPEGFPINPRNWRGMEKDAHQYALEELANTGSFQAAREKVTKSNSFRDLGPSSWDRDYLQELDDLEALGVTVKPNTGRMYEVEIAARPEQFLDWDIPYDQQSPSVQKGIIRTMDEPGRPSGWGLDLHELALLKGNELYELVDEQRWQRDLEPHEIFPQAGIQGVKYLDGNSRKRGEGTSNYVVFDDRLISIIRKYGIGAALGLGLISQDEASAAEAQGFTTGQRF